MSRKRRSIRWNIVAGYGGNVDLFNGNLGALEFVENEKFSTVSVARAEAVARQVELPRVEEKEENVLDEVHNENRVDQSVRVFLEIRIETVQPHFPDQNNFGDGQD